MRWGLSANSDDLNERELYLTKAAHSLKEWTAFGRQVRGYFTQVPDLIGVWVLVCSLSAAKAVALTERATRAAMATIMDFFIMVLL
jgi:hypothetical protein